MGNSFKLDDLLRDDDGVKPPQKKKGAAVAGGYALDDLLGPDTAAPPAAPIAPQPVVPAPANPVAPAPAPAPRRGFVSRIGDAIGGAVQSVFGGTETEGTETPLRFAPEETRRPIAIPDRTTPEQKNAAVRRRYEATVRQRPEQTAVLPAGSIQSHVDQAKTIKGNAEESALRARFSPKAWREIATKGMELANRLHAEGKHDEAEDANKKAYNAQLVADGAEQADTYGAIALSSLLGIVHDPYGAQKRNISEIEGKGLTFSPEEQQADLGMTAGVPVRRGFDPMKDLAVPAAASLPVYIAGGMAGRAALGGIAGLAGESFPRIRSIAQGLAAEAETVGIYGPKQAGVAGLREAGENFAQNVGTLAKRGATQGQVIGAVQAARDAQQSGLDPAEAAIQSVVMGVPTGVIGELLGGAVSRLHGVAERTHLDGRRGVELPLNDPQIKPVVQAVEVARDVQGKTPLADQTIEGQHATLAKALGKVLDQKQASEAIGPEVAQAAPPPAGRRWWESNAPEHEPLIEPGSALRPREDADNAPLRSQLDVANERAGTPRGEADAVVQMERARREEALMRENDARMAEDARLEAAAAQSAREKQGPLTAAQTIARAGRDADAGEPLAVEYKQAINDHIDALARVTDAGEKGPTTRDRVALARSKAKLDEFRRKYGTQTGSAALLAVAASQDDLTDDEKKMVGLGAVALSTGVVKTLPHGMHRELMAALDEINVGPDVRKLPGEWIERLKRDDIVFGAHEGAVEAALMRAETGNGGGGITFAEARAAIESIAPQGEEPISKGFASRAINLVNDRQVFGKKWDTPQPAADWIGKLKGAPQSVSKVELEGFMHALEYARDNKLKLTREQVEGVIEANRPILERHTLQKDERPVAKHTGSDGDPDDLMDMSDLEEADRDVLDEQIRNRHARLREIDEQIESQQESAAEDMNAAEAEQNRTRRKIREHIAAGAPDADISRALDAMDDELNGSVGADYVPDSAIDKAFNSMVEEGELYPRTEPHDPESQNLTVTENDDETWTISKDGTDQSWTAPTKEEAMALAEKAGEYEPGMSDYLLPSGFVVTEEVPLRFSTFDAEGNPVHRNRTVPSWARGETDEWIMEELKHQHYVQDGGRVELDRSAEPDFVLRDQYGTEHARGSDRAEMVAGLAQERFEDSNTSLDLDQLREYVNEYAHDMANYMDKESTHYSMTEDAGGWFDDAYAEKNRIDDELTELQTMHANAVTGPTTQPATDEAAANPLLAPIEPPVKGNPEYATYQRIGGGTNYRELVTSWENPPGGNLKEDAYGGHDYWSRAGIENTVAHARAEDHAVHATVGLEGEKVSIPDDLPPILKQLYQGVSENRAKRRALLKDMGELGDEFDALPADQQTGPRAYEIANEYRSLNQQVIDLGRREDTLAAEIRDKRGSLLGEDAADPETMAVMLEAQASLAQHQVTKGGGKPDIAAAEAAWKEAVQARVEGNTETLRLLDERSRLSDEAQHWWRTGEKDWKQRVWAHARTLARNAEDRGERVALPLVTMEEGYMVPSDELPTESLHTPRWAPLRQALRDFHAVEPEALMAAKEALDIHDEVMANLSSAEQNARQALYGAQNWVDTGPFGDTGRAQQVNVARFLIDAAERGHSRIAWSDGANRIQHANLQQKAARLWYDQMMPNTFKRILGWAGFKDVDIEKLYIKGNGHYSIRLTPEMRAAIRKNGLPFLGVAAMVAAPEDAQAQDGKEGKGSLYATGVGGIAAGALIMAMAKNKRLRRVVKENREMSRALSLDDLSGLSNQRGFARAMESVNRNANTAWVAFDGDNFKKLNDTHGHPEGDKAIAHFGKAIRETAEELGIPMRGFRTGGDEFAFAVAKDRAPELMAAVEANSTYTKGDVTTRLTGAIGDTWDSADASLIDIKDQRRAAGITQPRDGATAAKAIGEIVERVKAPSTEAAGMRLYANPVGPALSMLKRYPSAAGVAAAGAMMTQVDDNEMIRRAGVPTMALAALSAIGSRRLWGGADWLGSKLVDQLRKSDTGTRAVRAFNPDALLDPAVRQAVIDAERMAAKGKARAVEFSGKAKKLGPAGDRAVSDVIENEQWEDTSNFSAQQTNDVLSVAAEMKAEYDRLTSEEINAGTLDPKSAKENYAGTRMYAYHEAQRVLEDAPGGSRAGRSNKITGTKERTLDRPIREAEAKLSEAFATGDPAQIQAAKDAVDEAHVVQMSKRVELGEIRESSYRASHRIELAHHNVAAAKLFETLRATPGTVHPEWDAATSNLLAATQMKRAAMTQADYDAAHTMQLEARSEINDITRRFRQKGGDFVSLPDSPSLGMLSGAVVQRDVAHSLQGFEKRGTLGQLHQAWKEIKTVFNLGTHGGNIASNTVALHMGEVPIWKQPELAVKAFKDLATYGEATRALSEAGVMHVNATTGEQGALGQAMRSEEGLEELAETTRPETQKVLREQGIKPGAAAMRRHRQQMKGMAIGAGLGFAKSFDTDNPEDTAAGTLLGAGLGAVFNSKRANKIRALYGHEDNVARMMVYLRRRQLGDTKAQAVEAAVNSLGNFRSRSPALRGLSNTVAPFIMYQAKAVPAFARSVVDHPWKYLSLMAAWGAMNEMGKDEAGEVPENDIPLNQRRDAGYFFPGFTQLPAADARGNKAATDIARWTPMSGLTTGAPPGSVAEGFSDEGMQLTTPGGPAIDAALRLSNIDPFSKGAIVKRDRPVGENVGNLLGAAADLALPSMIGFHGAALKHDMDNEDWDKFKNDLLGPLGARPRYVRPGAVARDAEFTLARSLRDDKQEYTKALRAAANSEERKAELREQFKRRVATAFINFKARVGTAPSKELVEEFMPNE